MDNQKIHIDKYFQEKVKTQEVEGEIPSFDDFLLANSQSGIIKTASNSWLKTTLIAGSIASIIAIAAYCLFWEKAETKIQNPKHEIEKPIELKSIQQEINLHNIKKEVKQVPTKSAPKANISKGEIITTQSNETVIANELTPTLQKNDLQELQTSKIESPKIENPKTIETPATKKEELKGFDLYMDKNKSENEEGVKLYKK